MHVSCHNKQKSNCALYAAATSLKREQYANANIFFIQIVQQMAINNNLKSAFEVVKKCKIIRIKNTNCNVFPC